MKNNLEQPEKTSAVGGSPTKIKIEWTNSNGKKISKLFDYNSFTNTVDFGIAVIPATKKEIAEYLKVWGCELIGFEIIENIRHDRQREIETAINRIYTVALYSNKAERRLLLKKLQEAKELINKQNEVD